MKKLLFLLLITVASYGQTYQNPTFGTVTTKTAPTATTDPYVSTLSPTGVIGKVAPENIPLTIIPPTTHYSPVTANLKGHLQGIDNAIGNIPLTTAGNTTRVWFTGDATTIGAGTFYLTNPTNKGTVANVSQSVINDDNQKKYFTQDLIGNAFATTTIFPPGVYAGNLSGSTTPNSAQQRFTVELYRCDTNGTPIASGIPGAPVGSLGVTVIIILDSGLLTLADGSVTNIPVSANLASALTVAVGERIRYHVSAEKVGTAASNITESVYYGTSYNSYLDVPTPITSSGVSNLSTVTGATVTVALDNLKSSDQLIAGAGVPYGHINDAAQTIAGDKNLSGNTTISGTISVPTPTLSTHAVTKAYADGLVVGLLEDRGSYNASSNLFPTTGGSGVGGSILKGDLWYISVAGTLGGRAVAIGDSFRALVDTPGQTASNWSLLSSNLSYVPANDANVVHLTGNENIAGNKTLTGNTVLSSNINSIGNGSTPTISQLLTISGQITGATTASSITNRSMIQADVTGTAYYYVTNSNTQASSFTLSSLSHFTAIQGTFGAGSAVNSQYGFFAGSNLTGASSNFGFRGDVPTGANNWNCYMAGTAPNYFAGGIGLGTATTLGAGTLNATGNITTIAATTANHAVIKSQLDLKSDSASPTFTGDPKAPTATAGDNDTSIATTAFVTNAVSTAVPYKKYVALLSQTGTSAPTATVLNNTLGGTVVWTRSGTGVYVGTLSGVFTANKTIYWYSKKEGTSPTAGNFSMTDSSTSTIQIATRNTSNTLADDMLVSTLVYIEVYP